MGSSFAALLFRSGSLPERALSEGFAVALAGWDAPAPRLDVGELPGVAGWSAAFYSSGARLPRGGEGEEIDHAAELFEDELPPAAAVLDIAAELERDAGGRSGASPRGAPAGGVVYAIVFAEDALLDDAYRFDSEGATRRFVREGEDGLEAGVVTADEARVDAIAVDVAPGASESEEARAVEAAIRPHRGSTFLSRELGAPALPALMGALFAADRRIAVRLVAAGAEAVAEETRHLVRALGRAEGRAAFEPPAAVAGVATPEIYRSFVRHYDWADPADPADLYRGLALGAIEGTLRFLRADDLSARDADKGWLASGGTKGVFPIATISGSALGRAAVGNATLGVLGGREELVLVGGARAKGEIGAAGPTLGELLRYLALGWSKRSDAEEDMIQALMLRAKLMSEGESRP